MGASDDGIKNTKSSSVITLDKSETFGPGVCLVPLLIPLLSLFVLPICKPEWLWSQNIPRQQHKAPSAVNAAKIEKDRRTRCAQRGLCSHPLIDLKHRVQNPYLRATWDLLHFLPSGVLHGVHGDITMSCIGFSSPKTQHIDRSASRMWIWQTAQVQFLISRMKRYPLPHVQRD